MTLVNHETGEIIETLSKADAQRLTDRIRLLAGGIADQLDKMAGLIDEARVGSAWLALGYSSWTAYVAAEFENVLPRLDREPRREFVRELASRGMSTRAIAPVVGVSKSQVAADIEVSSSGHLPKVAAGTQAEGDGSAESRFESEASSATAPRVGGSDYSVPVDSRPSVTGIDGKTYTRPRATEHDLAQFIDSDQSIADGRYLVALMKELGKVAAVHQFDPDRIAALADQVTFEAIDAAFENFSTWRDQVKSKRGGLRVIKGGNK